MFSNDGALQNVIGDLAVAVSFRDRMDGRESRRANANSALRICAPNGGYQIGPKDAAADGFDGVQQVMMIVPVGAEIDKTQHVTQEDRQQRLQRVEFQRCVALSIPAP